MTECPDNFPSKLLISDLKNICVKDYGIHAVVPCTALRKPHFIVDEYGCKSELGDKL
jgi:hypothetical protein